MLSCGFFALILSGLLLSPSDFTSDSLPSADGTFITEWLLLGPFRPNDLDADFLAQSGGQARINPQQGDHAFTAAGDTLHWMDYRSEQVIIDLIRAIGPYQHATAYAFCTLNSGTEGRHQFLLGSDDGAAVWVNGQLVHYHPAGRSLFLDQDVFGAELHPGPNHVLVKIDQGAGEWRFALRVLPPDQKIDPVPRLYLAKKEIENGTWLVHEYWKFHPGDNPAWSAPHLDDRSWPTIQAELQPATLSDINWTGVGWFRMHLVVDSALIGTPIGLTVRQAGTSAIYLDGTLIHAPGIKSYTSPDMPDIFVVRDAADHVLAVRHENRSTKRFEQAGIMSGFTIRLGNPTTMNDEALGRMRSFAGFQLVLTSLSIAIGLLHLILFAFSPGLKQNLYFALFLFAYAAAIYFDYAMLLSTDTIGRELIDFRIHSATLPFWVIFQLLFVYSLFHKSLPLQFWAIAAAAIALGGLIIYQPYRYFEYFGYVYAFAYIEIIWVIGMAIYQKREGAWIIAAAFLVFFVFGALDTLMDQGYFDILREIENPYAFGSIAFILGMSVYLSHVFALSHRKIAEQRVEQQLLEAENERQAQELEAARQLQLSMLPKELPRLDHLEIAAFMKTATEVGGDYYDFTPHEDGRLTIAIGDATGHGMQAGIVVSAAKSLFQALAGTPDPVQFLQKASRALKAMNMKKLFMALVVAKINDHKLTVASAGMPFPLIYHNDTGDVEELKLKGMPLGAVSKFPYQKVEVNLNKGDTVLFTSDGFEEMFNPEREILGHQKAIELFRKAATQSPGAIIEMLLSSAEQWADGQPQEDDMTFVVIKVIA